MIYIYLYFLEIFSQTILNSLLNHSYKTIGYTS